VTPPSKKKSAPQARLVARDQAPRSLTDPREMRALAHPVRLAILESLTREGPLTATEAAEIVDESPANCSFHLRTLAKYGFVEEVPGSTGRARPWRRVALGQSFSEDQEDPAASIAAYSLAGLAHERVSAHLQQFRENIQTYPKEWRDAAFTGDTLVYLTPAELTEISTEIFEILSRYRERTQNIDQRPPDSGPVQLAASGFPLPRTPSGN